MNIWIEKAETPEDYLAAVAHAAMIEGLRNSGQNYPHAPDRADFRERIRPYIRRLILIIEMQVKSQQRTLPEIQQEIQELDRTIAKHPL
jgi:hypothetical protein